jgi:hypothetical protein
MGINYAGIKSNLIKVSEYNQLYEFKINTFEIIFANSNLIEEINFYKYVVNKYKYRVCPNRYAFISIYCARIRSNLIKVSEYDQLYEFKINKNK